MPGEARAFGMRLDGAPYPVYVQVLHVGHGLNWLVVTAAPLSDFAGEMNLHLLMLAVGLALVLIGALLLSWRIAAWITRDVSSLSAAVRQLGEGGVNIDFTVERHDEIGQLGDALHQMHAALNNDPLTGLCSRVGLTRNLERAIARQGASFSLLFIDLNGFKAINDTYGHDAGDQALIEVAERLRSAVRQGDLVARLSGDEFVVVLWRVDSDAVAAQVAGEYPPRCNPGCNGCGHSPASSRSRLVPRWVRPSTRATARTWVAAARRTRPCTPTSPPARRRASAQMQGRGQVAHRRLAARAHGLVAPLQAIEGLQVEDPRDQAQDRAGVIDRVVHRALARERRDHQCRHARVPAPSDRPWAAPRVPPAAVLVDGDDDDHVRPLRTLLQVLHRPHDMPVAAGDVGVAGMHVEVALRLVEGHRRQLAGARVGEEAVARRIVAQPRVAQSPRPFLGILRAQADEVVERLVVVLEVGILGIPPEFLYCSRVACQAPAYQAQSMPFLFSLSPMCSCVCGTSTLGCAGSA
jgi:GGDEF domain-containing protein